MTKHQEIFMGLERLNDRLDDLENILVRIKQGEVLKESPEKGIRKEQSLLDLLNNGKDEIDSYTKRVAEVCIKLENLLFDEGKPESN